MVVRIFGNGSNCREKIVTFAKVSEEQIIKRSHRRFIQMICGILFIIVLPEHVSQLVPECLDLYLSIAQLIAGNVGISDHLFLACNEQTVR